MAELLMKNFDTVFPELYRYTYKMEKEYTSGLSSKYQTYNNTMKTDIIYLKNEPGNGRDIKRYFAEIAQKFKEIQSSSAILGGMPTIKGTRIPVSLMVACFKDEMTVQEICEEYNLTRDEVEKSMEYTMEILDTPYQEGLE
nr:DUF433 domain-containing protein [uncultured Acetatifactor sp.]